MLSSSWYYDAQPRPLAGGGPVGAFVDGFAPDIWWAPLRSTVAGTVIDISDPENASIVSRTEIDGSRAIDGASYLIVDDYVSFPMPSLVNDDDVTFMAEAVFETHLGDTDLDEGVDFADFLALSANSGKSGGWAQGDSNGDGLITPEDFLALAANFGNGRTTPQAPFRG